MYDFKNMQTKPLTRFNSTYIDLKINVHLLGAHFGQEGSYSGVRPSSDPSWHCDKVKENITKSYLCDCPARPTV